MTTAKTWVSAVLMAAQARCEAILHESFCGRYSVASISVGSAVCVLKVNSKCTTVERMVFIVWLCQEPHRLQQHYCTGIDGLPVECMLKTQEIRRHTLFVKMDL